MTLTRLNKLSLALLAAGALAACDQPPPPAPPPAPPAPVAAPAPAPAAAPAPTGVAADAASPQKEQAEMADQHTTVAYKSADGRSLKVTFYEAKEPGVPDEVHKAKVQIDGGPVLDMSKVTEDKGDPVYGDGASTTLISRGGGGTAELFEGKKKTVFE
ncbi:hypothetical protein [Ottowia testudinis]|uniref:Lipoprotein n=1 Tax=Ottowia testudinis TaxID=2816950 RepID=A0A975CH08_9BURK|nr:hypothetical protein [Ottowia testudinis]QTD44752.1 hypothetical protein J1M35_16945 [Ottowia testudinis]